MEATLMNTWKRILIGILCYIFAICLFSIGLDSETVYLGALFGIAGTFVLRREWMIIITLLFKAATTRIKKVEKERQCALCPAPPLYMLHLVAIDPEQAISPAAGVELHVCRAHHPNKEVGGKADELHRLIKRIDKNLTYDRVYPYIFY